MMATLAAAFDIQRELSRLEESSGDDTGGIT